jgi:hypothetical protein
LKDLNTIVFLLLKPKGERNHFTCIKKLDTYKALIDLAFELKARVGFDSCSASSFARSIVGRKDFDNIMLSVEPCESTLFSYYINVDGIGFPCSFTEGQPNYKGINIKEAKDFLKDIWFNEETVNFRNKVINNKNELGCRMCPEYRLEMEDENQKRICQ